MALARGSLLSVNVGRIRHFEFEGHPAVSAIWKTPITWRVDVSGVNLAGDDQADRAAHGGPDKAVYAYASEDLLWWTQELGRPVEPGEMGENFTIEGIDVSAALVGERWEVGSAVFEVSEPRVPCWRLGARMEDKLFPRRFAQAGRPGAYLRIVTEGDVGAGDEVRVIRRPDHAVTVGDIFRIFTRDRHDAARLLTVSQMSLGWRRWAEDRRKGSELIARDRPPSPACPDAAGGAGTFYLQRSLAMSRGFRSVR